MNLSLLALSSLLAGASSWLLPVLEPVRDPFFDAFAMDFEDAVKAALPPSLPVIHVEPILGLNGPFWPTRKGARLQVAARRREIADDLKSKTKLNRADRRALARSARVAPAF